jgi:hypothetical protein
VVSFGKVHFETFQGLQFTAPCAMSVVFWGVLEKHGHGFMDKWITGHGKYPFWEADAEYIDTEGSKGNFPCCALLACQVRATFASDSRMGRAHPA